MADENLDRDAQVVKIVLLGDSGVGKSSLALRFVTNEFKPYSECTIGASFMSKTISVQDERPIDNANTNTRSKKVAFKIWDTAGQEKYHSLAPMYYRLVRVYYYSDNDNTLQVSCLFRFDANHFGV